MNKKISYNSVIPQLNDDTIYAQGEFAVYKALEIAKTLNDETYTENEPTNLFVYWVGNNLNEKHEIAIKSFLVTQDINNIRLKIYSDVDLNLNPIIQKIKSEVGDKFDVCIFDIEKEVKDTPLEDCVWNNLIKNHNLNAALESDYFRILMLYKYGGVYSDFDILYLRNINPLMKYEWVYQWGSEQYRMNGAIMRLKKESNIARKHTEFLKQISPVKNSLCWADDIYQKVREEYDDFVVFPGAFFNPEWQIPLDSTNFFTRCNDSLKMFENSFCWHFHNKWNKQIELGSKMDILKNKVNYLYKKIKK